MRQLLRNDTKFKWTDKCSAELEELKIALTSNPIMKPLQPNRPVYLTVDAGKDGIGSMLWQLDNNNVPHVCGYLSTATTPNQKKWLPFQLEMFGLAMSLRAYEKLLLGNEVHVFTDNAVVVHLQKYRPMNARETRMIAYLSQFHLDIKYVKGVHNYTADCLSRLYEDLDDSQIQRMRPDERILQEEFILPVTSEEIIQEPQAEINVKQADEKDSQDSSGIEIAPGQWAAYFLHTRSSEVNSQSPSEHMHSLLNPLAESFSPQAYVEESHEQAVNTINSEPRRSSRLQEKREKLMSRTRLRMTSFYKQ